MVPGGGGVWGRISLLCEGCWVRTGVVEILVVVLVAGGFGAPVGVTVLLCICAEPMPKVSRAAAITMFFFIASLILYYKITGS